MSKLFFQSLYVFKIAIFFKAITFSQEPLIYKVLFQNIFSCTACLVFIATFCNYPLVQTLKDRSVCRCCILQKMLPLNSMFCFYTAAHTTLSTLSDHLSKHVKNFGFNKKINFSNESVKKTTIYDFLFLIAIYFLQNVNKYISEMKIFNK